MEHIYKTLFCSMRNKFGRGTSSLPKCEIQLHFSTAYQRVEIYNLTFSHAAAAEESLPLV